MKSHNKHENLTLYGWHACKSALQNPQREILSVHLTRNVANRLAEEGIVLSLELDEARPSDLDKRVGKDAVHQGIAIACKPLSQPTLEEVRKHKLILFLDRVTDPHNVGAILRSACALGAGAVVTTWRHAPAESGLLAKTASGAFEFIPYIQVTNLGRALNEARALGFTLIGLDSEGEASLSNLGQVNHSDQLALVLGAEGSGLRRLTRETCDVLARLDMPGPIKSLNVSNAAALALYQCRLAIDAQSN